MMLLEASIYSRSCQAVQHCTWNLSGIIWDLDVESLRTSTRKLWDSTEILLNALNEVSDMVLEDDDDRQCQHHWQI